MNLNRNGRSSTRLIDFAPVFRFLMPGFRLMALGAVWSALVFMPCSAAAADIQNGDCLDCHTEIQIEAFASSAHGNNLCLSCHADIQSLPHEEKLEPVDCSRCHPIETEVYTESDHGQAVQKGTLAASCTDCHGHSHLIIPARDPRSPMHRRNQAATCGVCHEDEKRMTGHTLLEEHPIRSYSKTVHGEALLERGNDAAAACSNCHGSHDLHRPTNPLSKINRSHIAQTCGKCHENILITYERSVHGKAAREGKLETPVCTDCHGEHTIRTHRDPESRVYATNVSERVCGQCHAAEKIISKYRLPADRLKTYLESYHGLASRHGSTTVANCASCHGAHDVLPSSDPASSVNKKNLPKTCGRCHPNAGEQLAKGSIHLAPSFDRDKAVYVVSLFYIFLIVVVIGGMLIHNSLDFLRKLREHYVRKKGESREPRFTRGERVQHWILTISFLVLAYTGFAFKFPDVWWTIPFRWWDPDHVWRGWIHRATAVVFTALCVYHVLYLALSRRGRGQFRALLPASRDFRVFWRTLRHNLGVEPAKPESGCYAYTEKVEYWALVWGSFIMIATGVILTFENISLKYFPMWMLDVATTIHYFEAVLATLAVLVWHGYFTVFDPEHYPMNWSIWTGRTHEKRSEENSDDR